ncbi:MAG: hypothetical protein M3Z66_02635, partial [Chloroflexota bacterium]|nr:hypothetical protein [Chloroflexota bacterium]
VAGSVRQMQQKPETAQRCRQEEGPLHRYLTGDGRCGRVEGVTTAWYAAQCIINSSSLRATSADRYRTTVDG